MNLKSEKIDSASLRAQEMIMQIRQGSFLLEGEDASDMIKAVEELVKNIFCSMTGYGEHCGRCNDCQMLQKGNHPDLYWLSSKGASSSIKIEDIRWLREYVSVKPYQSQKKVFVIQDAQRLTTEAANALLKTLEEPPQDAVLILIAQSASQLLPTVVSRCQQIRFSKNSLLNAQAQEDPDEFSARFLDDDGLLRRINFYEEINALERKQVENILQELAYVLRDMQLISLKAGGIAFLSGKPEKKLQEWAENFSHTSIEQIMDEVLRTKNYVQKNSNIKLAIDSLCKFINKHKLVTTNTVQ